MTEPNTATTADKPAAKAAPAKPAAKPAPKKGPERRSFLFAMFGTWIGLAWTTFTAAMVGMTLGTVRFLFPNVLSEPPTTINVGDLANYEEGVVSDQFKEKGMWVVRWKDEQGRDIIYALSTTCTHLGCTPNWLESEQKFKCPCHGSGFYITGVNFEGPAPRPLERYAIRKSEDGTKLIVDKSLKFQKELGQWDNPESYIVV